MNANRQTKSAAEFEITDENRRMHTALQRPGETSRIKRNMRRRERHEAKASIRQGGEKS